MTSLLEELKDKCPECGGTVRKAVDQEGYCCDGCCNRYVFFPAEEGVEEDDLLVTYENGCKDPLLEAMKVVEALNRPFQLERIVTSFENTEQVTWWASFDHFEKTAGEGYGPAKAIYDAALEYKKHND